jgi:hypothetical protein
MLEQIASKDYQNIISPTKVSEKDLEIIPRGPVHFQTHVQGIMDMYSSLGNVAEYLNNHEGWFVRCASPMKAEPFGPNGYTLTIGHYASFGYEVEPKMSVILETPQPNSYSMYSVDNPEFNNLGYEVDYKAIMNIEEWDSLEAVPEMEKLSKKQGITNIPSSITKINWKLDLNVKVEFPQFIYKLPLCLLEKTGDRLLAGIVKQISPRLSYKVQKDFHSQFNLPLPPKGSRICEVVNS